MHFITQITNFRTIVKHNDIILLFTRSQGVWCKRCDKKNCLCIVCWYVKTLYHTIRPEEVVEIE